MTAMRSPRRGTAIGIAATPRAVNASEVSAIHTYCAVYTKAEVVTAVLDGIGWTAGQDLRTRRLLEPAAGDGAFLVPAIERLLGSAGTHGFLSEAGLTERVLALEFEPGTAKVLAARVRRVLRAGGLAEEACHRLVRAWVRCEDFLTAELAAGFTDVVGNPPYMRWSKLPKGLRAAYEASLPAHAARGDLCLAFVCRSVDLLAPDSARVAVLCADRWLKCAYGEAARSELRAKVRVASHVEAHGLPVFSGTREVTTYAALTVMDTDVQGGGVVVRPNNLAGFLRAVRRPARSQSRVQARRLLRPEGGAVIAAASVQDLLAAVQSRHPALETAGVKVRCGMALGCAQAFVVGPDADIEAERLVPFLRSQDLTVAGGTIAVKCLANVWQEDGDLVDLQEWPRLAAHLAPWQVKLSQRACVGETSPWHRTIDRLHANRGPDRVLVAGMARRSRVALAGDGEQPSNALYVLSSRQWPTSALFALLRSGFLDIFAEGLSPTFSGASRRFDGNVLRQVRVPQWSSVGAEVRKALEAADPQRALGRPSLVSEVLGLRAAAHRKAVDAVLSAIWGADLA